MGKGGGVVAILMLGVACVRSQGPRWAGLGRSCRFDAPAVGVPVSVRDSLPMLVGSEPTVDDRWAAAARDVPGGWGGVYKDGATLVLYLVDTTRLEDATAALVTLGILPGTDSRLVTARQGRWDFSQLHEWYRYLTPQLVHDDGFASAGIDEAHNRITYGVTDNAARTRFERVLAGLGVPCFLVALEVTGPIIAQAPGTR